MKAARSEGWVFLEQREGGGKRIGQGCRPSGIQSTSKLEGLPVDWVLIPHVDSHRCAVESLGSRLSASLNRWKQYLLSWFLLRRKHLGWCQLILAEHHVFCAHSD